MAVALDVAGTVITGTVSPVASSASITVGAGASCLIVVVQGDDNTTTVTAPTWNGVSTTLIGTIATTDNGCFTKFYGLISPASGAQSLSVSFSGGAPGIHMCAVSFSGSNTASVAACFTNFVSQANNTASTSSTVTVTSAVGNYTIGAANGNNATLSLTQTAVYSTTSTFQSAETRATGAATVVYTGGITPAATNTIAGVNIVAAAGGVTDLRNFFVAPWREPVRIKPSVVWQQFRAEPPGGVSKEDIARFEWTTLWQDPVRIKPAVAYQQFLAFDPIVIAAQSGTGDMWYASWSSTGRRVILIGTG